MSSNHLNHQSIELGCDFEYYMFKSNDTKHIPDRMKIWTVDDNADLDKSDAIELVKTLISNFYIEHNDIRGSLW